MYKISDYQDVHPLKQWKDLKYHVRSHHRCFTFTHQAIPHEPMMVLHTALTTEPSSNTQVCVSIIIEVCDYNYSNYNEL